MPNLEHRSTAFRSSFSFGLARVRQVSMTKRYLQDPRLKINLHLRVTSSPQFSHLHLHSEQVVQEFVTMMMATNEQTSTGDYCQDCLPPDVLEKLEAGSFRNLCQHLQERSDEVQNIDLMSLGGFCRNCLAKVSGFSSASFVQ